QARLRVAARLVETQLALWRPQDLRDSPVRGLREAFAGRRRAEDRAHALVRRLAFRDEREPPAFATQQPRRRRLQEALFESVLDAAVRELDRDARSHLAAPRSKLLRVGAAHLVSIAQAVGERASERRLARRIEPVNHVDALVERPDRER